MPKELPILRLHARALLDASRVIPDRADDYRRRGQQLLDELGAAIPEAERFPS